ncbi:hypothetical protein A6R68_01065, partial [Neotoma lepida]
MVTTATSNSDKWYDSIHGKFHSTVMAQNEKKLIIKGKAISMFRE